MAPQSQRRTPTASAAQPGQISRDWIRSRPSRSAGPASTPSLPMPPSNRLRTISVQLALASLGDDPYGMDADESGDGEECMPEAVLVPPASRNATPARQAESRPRHRKPAGRRKPEARRQARAATGTRLCAARQAWQRRGFQEPVQHAEGRQGRRDLRHLGGRGPHARRHASSKPIRASARWPTIRATCM